MKNLSKTKAKLICFTGIDGSGKTTLAKELVKIMNERGIRYNYIYGRLEPFMLKPFIWAGRKIFLKGKDMFTNYTDYSRTKSSTIERHSFLFTFYRHVLLFDYFIQLLFKVRLPFLLGKNIVCDRYVYDTVITDLSDMNYSVFEIRGLIEKCFYVAPKPDSAFLIDLPEAIAYQRKEDTPSIEYLMELRKVYLDIGEEYNMVILDGCKDLTVLKVQVQKEVF
jgi:thymidylate kinase